MTATVPPTSARDPHGLAVRREGRLARPRIDEHVGEQLEAGVVDEMRHARGLGGGDGDLRIRAHAHALGLEPNGDLGDGVAALAVDDGDERIVFVGDVETLALGIDRHQLRVGPGLDAARDFELLGVDHPDAIVVAECYEHLLIVGRHDDAARPAADLDGLDDLQAVAVDHGDRIVALVGDENGRGERMRRDEREQPDEECSLDQATHGQCPRLGNLHLLSGASTPSVSVGNLLVQKSVLRGDRHQRARPRDQDRLAQLMIPGTKGQLLALEARDLEPVREDVVPQRRHIGLVRSRRRLAEDAHGKPRLVVALGHDPSAKLLEAVLQLRAGILLIGAMPGRSDQALRADHGVVS